MLGVLLIIGVLLVFAPVKTLGSNCVSVAEDRALIEAKDWVWLGLRRAPFTRDVQLVFYRAGQFTLVSPVVEGCVMPDVTPIGFFVDEAEI